MVSVPGGEFVMGFADQDSQGYNDERPQHPVTVPSFFMGRYPVTVETWPLGTRLTRRSLSAPRVQAHRS
ncbi:SUMF1/EgtB/PvdO family nonheme iron enzyme [Leptolyngbya sp. PCC 6406]|uniref:formylglycine-generating enzyme family protein n=1 Tax=Leptolyngbya sp. PCC 6406 TaxID=1173264 RepID=UPI0002AD05FA